MLSEVCYLKGTENVKEIEKIKLSLKKCKVSVQKKYSVKSIGVFGSYVRNEQKKQSDLDILVEFNKTPGLIKFMELENELSSYLNKKVDLVMKSALKPVIGKNILGEVIYL